MSQNLNRIGLEIIEGHQKVNQNSDATLKSKNSNDETSSSFRSTLDRINPISRANFLYIFKLTLRSRKVEKKRESLTDKDLITFPRSFRGEVLEEKFMKHLQDQKKRNPTKRPSTALAVFMSVKWTYFLAVLLKTLFGFSKIMTGWVMKRLIECYLDPELATTDSYWWAAIVGGLMLLTFYFDNHWFHVISYLGVYVRSGVLSMLYTKITRLSIPTITKLSAGKLINLAANDVNLFEMTGFLLPSFISGWLIIIATAALMWIYFGVTCLLGIGYMIAFIPFQAAIAIISLEPRIQRNDVTDERIRKTSEAIEGIRLLKMYTWEKKFQEIIADLRKNDVKLTKKVLFWGDVMSRGLSWSCHYMASFLMFMLYYVTGGELTIAKVFSAYFVLGYTRIYFGFLTSQSFNFIAESRLLFKRLDEVMDAPEMDANIFQEPKNAQNAIEFDNFTAFWSKDTPLSESTELKRLNNRHDSKATLTDINLHIKKGSLNAVIGRVGASKTSLLLSLTGEIPETTGHLRYQGKIAYVEQEPTIFAGTVRESILFGKEYNEEFYNKVIKTCNLESDLKLFPNGDMTMIGERGNNLSGGQKARLALARAVYSDAEIYLLDDPLSAIDAKVAKSIFNETILGLLKNKTVILVTHQVHFVKDFENIIVLEEGKIAGKGKFEDLKPQGVDADKIFSIQKDPRQLSSTTAATLMNENVKSETKKEAAVFRSKVEANAAQEDQQDTDQSVEGEENPLAHASNVDPYNGQVNLTTYGKFLKEVGLVRVFGMVALYVLVQFGEIGYGRILGAWATGEFELGTALGTLGALALYTIAIYLMKNAAFTLGFLEGSKKYHEKMLEKVINSPVSFFDANPVGRVLSRFSGDLGVLDRFVPQVGLDMFDILAIAIGVFITLAIVEPLTIAPLAAAIILGAVIIVLCYPSMKHTKSYEMATRGTLFSLYSAVIPGMAVIRTYGQANNFKRKFTSLLNSYTKGNFNFILACRLACFWVDWVYNLIAIGMIYIITARIDPSKGSDAGAVAAFILVLILSLNGLFQHGVKEFCQTNILMACVARIQAYCELPSEAPRSLPADNEYRQRGWPQKGTIEFSKVYMKYRSDADFVIKDLDLQVNSGEKIGCVGRTGAGKSTIINLLFRMKEIDRTADHKDAYIKLDDTDTQPLGLHLLRENISIIPQTPFIFTGTVRQNLDPLKQFSDEQIWKTLEDVRLKDQISRLKDKLDTRIYNSSALFSVGQKQLICLARTILKPNKVLVLDEATANMDTETDNLIQQKVMEKFKDSTVFTIAHRLATIADYDKVLVLDKGKKVEFDAPYRLLVKNIGDETLTNAEGQFASMVLNTGPITSQKILNIAKQAYQKNGL